MMADEMRGGEQSARSVSVSGLESLDNAALVTINDLCGLIGRSRASVFRAIKRGDLPQPAMFFGKRCWRAAALLAHFDKILGNLDGGR